MKKFCVGAILTLKMIFCDAQMVGFNSSLRSFGLGTNSKNFTDAFSFCQNPAAVVQTNGMCAAIYSERKYGLDELNLFTGVVSIKKKNDAFGFEFHFLKWSHFSQSLLGLNYGRSLGRIDFGGRIVYQNMKIAGYLNTKSISGEVGGILRLSQKVNAGVHFSIHGSENNTYIYGAGIGCEVSENVFAGAAIFKQSNDRPSSNVGLIYRPASQFKLKAGLITESRQPYLSAGWQLSNLAVEIALSYHPQLGMSPGLFVSYQSRKKSVR